MTPHIEAGSLSEITQIAGNPPKYPRNPTERKRQPLILYIARVPGSRDIILTTLKPQPKNVTVEDVAASLYYLHLNTEDDVRFLEDNASLGIVTKEPESSLQKPLPRKPLPKSARSSLELDHSARSAGVSNALASIPKRKPLTTQTSSTEFRQAQVESNPVVNRRPLGPRPLGPGIVVTQNSLPGVENARPDPATRHQNVNSNGDGRQSFNAMDHVANDIHVNDFSLTLIRRDLSSGAQWNVGTICGKPVPSEAQHRRSKSSKKPYFEMSIQLTTPGYNQFRSPSATSHIGKGPAEAPSTTGVKGEAEASHVQPRSDSGFSRRLRMEGTSFWGRSSVHKRAQSDTSGERARARGMSGDWTFDSLNLPGNDTGSGDSQSKGYIFSSPWGGTCKFSTGSGGRTLRCKHILPAPISAAMSGDFTSASQPPSIVSELRFNLPSTAIFTPSSASDSTTKRSSVDSGRFSLSKFGHIRNKLSPERIHIPPRPALSPRPHPTSYAALYPSDDEQPPPLPPRSTMTSHLNTRNTQTESFRSNDTDQFELDLSDDEVDEDDRLDLSIGREKAGGGNRGKRAKLGKLIIHDEGFKMLDLAVAANMAIWWSVWEFDSR